MSTSKKMTPNKLEVVKKETSKFSGIKLPEEIREDEAHLYHVMIINSTPVPPTGWKHDSKIQMFDKNTFSLNKDNLMRLGYNQMFILHDPTIETKAPAEGSEGAGTGTGNGAPAAPAGGNEGAPAKALTYHEKLAILRSLDGIEGTPNKNMVEAAFETYTDYTKQAAELGVEITEEMKLSDIIDAVEEKNK